MSEFSKPFKAFSAALLQANKDLILVWAKDDGNPELSESCKMMIEAAGHK